jgi:hypoxanthine phosphoribosyltransferase
MMHPIITLGDKNFRLYITEPQIQAAVSQIANKLNEDYKDKSVLIIPVLNGSFMFASDLVKKLNCRCEISFIKTSSYKGTTTTGDLISLIGINEELNGRNVLILEDIIDTGHTLDKIIPLIEVMNPMSIRVATLLSKPEALQTAISIDYTGIEISNQFIVGYGLDYNGLGRNLKEIYKLIE